MTVDEIKNLIHDTIDTNSGTFPDERMVRAINYGLNKCVNTILETNPTALLWDDPNHDDLPIGYLDINANQEDYDLSEDEALRNLLYVHKVYAKDESGYYQPLELISIHDQRAQEALKGNDNSQPKYYYMIGKMLFLVGVPTYAQSQGLKIIFQRIPAKVTSSDTTRELGISTSFHYLVALHAAYFFARSKNLKQRQAILKEIMEEEERLSSRASDQDVATDYVLETEPDESI